LAFVPIATSRENEMARRGRDWNCGSSVPARAAGLNAHPKWRSAVLVELNTQAYQSMR
jgi:hypothetical protein